MERVKIRFWAEWGCAMQAASAQPSKGNVVLAPIQSWSLQDQFAGYVRALEPRDIPSIVHLHSSVYGDKYRGREKALQADLERIFFDNPWYRDDLPSLVYEANTGEVIGCVGVLPRPMRLNGRHITAAVSHSFMVEPGKRATLAAVYLVSSFFSGKQDLALAEVNNLSRRIWEGAGGHSSILYGLRWTRLLSPCRHVLSLLKNRGLPSAPAALLDPFCRFMDLLAPSVSGKTLRFTAPDGSVCADLDARGLGESFYAFTEDRLLKPVYDSRGYDWLVHALGANTRYGDLQKTVVRDAAGYVQGWYLYYMKPSGLAEVVQLVAAAGSMEAVLDSLFFQAKQRGAVAVTGQVDPAAFRNLAEKHCVFHHAADTWLMLHSRDPEILHAIESGKAFLSRLEGEWWISSILG